MVVATALALSIPLAGASLPEVKTMQPVDESAGTPCVIFGAGTCVFACLVGDQIRASLYWTGQISANCGGGSAVCVWGLDHLSKLESCNYNGTYATQTGVGTCIAIPAIVFGICEAV
ncbi:MAG: hypothetical protein WC876_07830 [Candidatus Thermoplasmatota archaeon]